MLINKSLLYLHYVFKAMFDNQEELKAHIEHVKRCLLFYALNEEELLKQGYPRRELERLIDIQLDKLIVLLKKLKG
ncbi:hypothetical protein IN666_01465 [Bacteroides fragilis]|nr:hypothetical protein [Bacteroides fragilis]